MTSRKRNNTTSSSTSRRNRRQKIRQQNVNSRRQHLLETLETRQLLAGPQLIGIQPNEGALITDGSQRDTAPRVLTFGFDEDQIIDENTFDGIRISRAGPDGEFNTADDVRITPGLVTLGDPNENEVVVRFVESLPDDKYRAEVFGFDDPGLGIIGLQNTAGELFTPEDPNQRSQITDFELKLGGLVEGVVPQPVIRNADGSLSQNRNEIVVYFNEDPLFVENDPVSGEPTERSAENPRFYQLLFTQETVRTTDDWLVRPETVVYDQATHTARLIFSDDINSLARDGNGDVVQGGGTWRLRIGTSVDGVSVVSPTGGIIQPTDLILEPLNTTVAPSAVTDFQHDGLRVTFFSTNVVGESTGDIQVRFIDTLNGGLTFSEEAPGQFVFDFGGDTPEVRDLRVAIASAAPVGLDVTFERNGLTGVGGGLLVPASVIGQTPIVLNSVGDSLGTALDVGVFGEFNQTTSLVFSESISPQLLNTELIGGADDPGHTSEVDHINPLFGADQPSTTDAFGNIVPLSITEIAYNFNEIFDTDFQGNEFLNQITERQKTRIREVLNLWSSKIGVQFRETQDEGITFALGDRANLQDRSVPAVSAADLDAQVRIDPTFNDSAVVFSNQENFGTAYGESFTRKSAAAVGLLLGLAEANDLPSQTLLAFFPSFLNATGAQSIDNISDLEPVFPSNFDVLHGQFLHRPDSIDVDLYRFEVDLDDADKVGTLTAETFSERLPDSSLLDTTLTLFEEVPATLQTDLGFGPDLEITLTSRARGILGNNSRIRFVIGSGSTVNVVPEFDAAGAQLSNAVVVVLPRTATAGQFVDAINADPLSSSLFDAQVTFGERSSVVGGSEEFSISLSGGGIEQLSRNDDYFGEDSRVIASLGEGVYYIGIAASGNNSYNPEFSGTSFGGRTQGDYDLHLKFEPQVDETDVIRDLDSDREDVPGTALDGNADGVPGGAHNFWFQTRPVNRILNFTDDGAAITPNQTISVVGGNGIRRTFEFVPTGGSAQPGNIAVNYSPGSPGFPTPQSNLASLLQLAVNTVSDDLGVSVSRVGSTLEFVGERSVDFSTGFRGIDALGRNIFVDKGAGPQADGSLSSPFNNIGNPVVANAFGSAMENDIVRIVGNGGIDNNLATEADNLSFQIGVADTGGTTLEDGRNMEVPRGVTTMIDAGAAFKLRNSFIGIGSSTVQIDRSGGALQVLGTPRLVQLSLEGDPIQTTLIAEENAEFPGYDDGSVIFTSTRDNSVDAAATSGNATPNSGNWGGLIYRRDVDQLEGRRDLEDEGIFLQRVNHAELRYGGGSSVLINSVPQLVNPVQIINMRPTVTFNEIRQSADAAISAAPNSFEETSYQSPVFQQAGAFTADYERVGPDVNNNQLLDNSINALFVRASTTSTEAPRQFTVSGRFDDIDVVHYIAENIVVAAAPGGSIADGFAPSTSLISGQDIPGGDLSPGDYGYKLTFVDADGFESKASEDTFTQNVPNANSSVQLTSLPQVGNDTDFVSRRLYRSFNGGGFRLVADLDASSINFIDIGTEGVAELDLTREGIRGRLDASLVLDPGLVVKVIGARIELGQGTQLLAEGLGSAPIVITSVLDDRYGVGGTFDTNNDNDTVTGDAAPDRGDWSGIYAGPTANVSFDNVFLSYAGGISLLEGGLARGFLPLELQQAEGRITNSRFEFNDSGQDGQGPAGRLGRLAVTPATIMVRGSQPIIVGNTFVDNRGSIIDIDIESMGGNYRTDIGRQSGDVDRFSSLDDNFGPLIRFNRYLNVASSAAANRQLSGLEIRGGTLTTETVFDDTDIAHLLFQNIEVGNFHSDGGLRLLSRPDESLVVKFDGSGNPNDERLGTGITATGATSSIEDRIGGTVHIVGLPGAPVILTSLDDDDAGSGLRPDGSQFGDHDGDGTDSRPFNNDWRGILLDQFSNDYNIPVLPELELSTESAPGLNGTPGNAQELGELSSDLLSGDHVRRLGFEVQGFLAGTTDIDTYSFVGTPGTEVWIDIDRTSYGLDSVIELLDGDGVVLARSDNSLEETAAVSPTPVTVFDPQLEGVTTSLQSQNEQYTERGVGGEFEDFGSINPRDAGIHYRLSGNTSNPNSRSTYFFRIRSAALSPDDAQGGITGGGYRVQVRLTEEQQFPGSVVRFADIRYANHGIHAQGLMASSPLLAEAAENEGFSNQINNNTAIGATPGSGAQYLGNLLDNNSNVIGVAGALGNAFNGFANDVDFYSFDVDYVRTNDILSTVFDIDYAAGFNRPDTNISVFYDADGFDPTNVNFEPRLVFFGSSSNIADDLTSPLGEDDAVEKLLRGSVSNGDPFIGPVVLPEGTYYVAVTHDGNVPSSLDGLVVEPINSLNRIIEDRFEPTLIHSTFNPPTVPELFTDAGLVGSGFTIGTDNQIGHGTPSHFDGTTGPTGVIRAPRFSEAQASGSADAPENPSGVGFGTTLDSLDFSLADDFDIGGTSQTINTSVTIPHVSIAGNLSGDSSDFYQFSLNASARVILDIDDAYDIDGEVDDDGDITTPAVQTDPFSVDTKLVLLEPDPNNPATFRRVRGDVSSSPTTVGSGGSNATNDPFNDLFLPAGTYFVGVLNEDAVFTIDDTGTSVLLEGVSNNPQTYTLHVSIEDHVVPPSSSVGGTGVLEFNRTANPASGTVVSEPFSLAGYEVEDLPTLYFNNFYDPSFGDTAVLTATSAETTTPAILHTFVQSLDWNQVRLSLADFAGETDIRFQLDYQTSGTPSLAAGLRLDDIIVGFAERGETVFGAPSGTNFTDNSVNAVDGEYQLEIRIGTEFADSQPAFFGPTTTLTAGFDTNDRHGRSVTIIAPEGVELFDGDTFVLGDGVANQIFEFEFPGGGGVTLGNTPVSVSPTFTSAQVAEAIRTAVNNQTVIDLEAASSGGEDTGTLTDGRLALSGNATGTFDVNVDAGVVRSGGNIQLSAILHDGQGDSNHLRTQGQIIVENNVIRDVRGIGIYSEPGVRDVVPAHDLNEPFLTQPPLGNSYPGAPINLPTLNDSVVGGLSPGIFIQNNTIENAEFAGIKVEGQLSPWAIAPQNGDAIGDGDVFWIDAGGTRVVFEFEDIGDGNPAEPIPGSGENGGDGVRDGNVPVYIRHNDDGAGVYLQRITEFTPTEVALSILQSIQGSILMTNGLVELVSPHVGTSLIDVPVGTGLDFVQPVVYVEGASGIYFPGGTTGISVYQAPVYEAPQPFARIINNTIYGNDGTEAAFPENAQGQDNDFLSQAIDTKLGRSSRATFVEDIVLGNSTIALPASADVDFFQVNLDVGDRLIADIDTVDGGPDTVLRIFDSSGNPQTFTQGGQPVTISQSAVAPDNVDPQGGGDPNRAEDPFADFSAPESGTYFVGVSSAGNEAYDPQSLSGRVAGADTGTYTLGLEVLAPRSFVISAETGAVDGIRGASILGQTFDVVLVDDVAGGTNTFTFTYGGNGLFDIPVVASDRLPDIMFRTAQALNRPQILNNGGPITPVEASAIGGPGGGGPVDFPIFIPAGFRYVRVWSQ